MKYALVTNPFQDSPRELYIIFFIKYLESYSYFVLSYTLILFLSREFAFTDLEAGWAYGFHGMLTSVYGFLMGSVIDTVGVKFSLVCGMLILCVSRFALAVCTDIHVLLLILFTLLPMGGSMGIPVMQIGVKRYTKKANRLHAYSAFYVIMNLAAITAAPAIDIFRTAFPVGMEIRLITGTVVHLSPFRILLLSGSMLTVLSFLLAFLFLRDVQLDETGELVDAPRPPQSANSMLSMYNRVLTCHKFWRFVLLILLLLGVRIIFRYLDCLFPKYMVREFGPDVLYGTIIAINPLCIVCLVPILSSVTAKVPTLKMILLGATISATSPFFLAFGHTYLSAVGFVTMLSLGEACWSPRLYEYTVSIADDGQEGTYMALANMPMFVATLLAGAMSGWLLGTFCPEVTSGQRHPEVMWFLVGCMSIMSPILLYTLKDIIEPKDSARRWQIEKAQALIKGLKTDLYQD